MDGVQDFIIVCLYLQWRNMMVVVVVMMMIFNSVQIASEEFCARILFALGGDFSYLTIPRQKKKKMTPTRTQDRIITILTPKSSRKYVCI